MRPSAPPLDPATPHGVRRGDVLLVSGTLASAAGVALIAAGVAQQAAGPTLWAVGIGLAVLGAVLFLLAVRDDRRRPPWRSAPWAVRFAVEATVLVAGWAALFLLFLPLWKPLAAWKVAYHGVVVILLATGLGVGLRRGREGRRHVGDRLRGYALPRIPDRPGPVRRLGLVGAGGMISLLAVFAAVADSREHDRFVIGAMIAQVVFWSIGLSLLFIGLRVDVGRRAVRG